MNAPILEDQEATQNSLEVFADHLEANAPEDIFCAINWLINNIPDMLDSDQEEFDDFIAENFPSLEGRDGKAKQSILEVEPTASINTHELWASTFCRSLSSNKADVVARIRRAAEICDKGVITR